MCKLDWKSSLPSVIEKELGLIAQKLLYSESLTLSGMTWQREKKKLSIIELGRIYK